MAALLTIEFIIFSFIGWLINTGYSSWDDGHYSDTGFFHAPFCPIYGFGGILLVLVLKFLSPLALSPIFSIIFATLFIIMLEYVGGKLTEIIFKIKLWNYSKAKYNLGYIDAFHSFCWLILVTFFYYFVFSSVLKFESFLVIPGYLNWPIFFLFLFIVAYFSICKYPSRFIEIENRVIDITVTEYRQIVQDIRRYRRTRAVDLRERLEEKIQKELEKRGLKMKKRG
jgi:uncharacterized membrane protein